MSEINIDAIRFGLGAAADTTSQSVATLEYGKDQSDLAHTNANTGLNSLDELTDTFSALDSNQNNILRSTKLAKGQAENGREAIDNIVGGSNNASVVEISTKSHAYVETLGTLATARFSELLTEGNSLVTRLGEILTELGSSARQWNSDIIDAQAQGNEVVQAAENPQI